MTNKKQLSFEESLKRLEDIVSQMENADPDLEKALTLFSEGAELIKFCSAKLDETKKKVEILTKENSEIKKEDFTG
ncbi:MAG: exodeoxyribonuclease VII small subunit [Elusimicrobiota bacterium]|jgi:exodeoxyribonuclease VII small subunit|nr:exodeoxyribonuclease VII small subunit [Elusimicrobiota bacterium]